MNHFKVERWWGTLLPKIAPYLYENGGPVVMVQVSGSATFKYLIFHVLDR